MTNPKQEKPRWRYRFDNYHRALALLREAIETMGERELTQLEEEGVIQRFEYTWELSWKTMKDFLEYQGIVFDTVTPTSTIRAAFSSKLIDSGDEWMAMLDVRNKMTHTYDLKTFKAAVGKIRSNYLRLFDQLHTTLLEISLRDD